MCLLASICFHAEVSLWFPQVKTVLYLGNTCEAFPQIRPASQVSVYPRQRGHVNSLTLIAAKTGLTILEISNLQKHNLKKTFEGEMLIRSETTTLLQIFCEFSLYSQVVFKSMRVADNSF